MISANYMDYEAVSSLTKELLVEARQIATSIKEGNYQRAGEAFSILYPGIVFAALPAAIAVCDEIKVALASDKPEQYAEQLGEVLDALIFHLECCNAGKVVPSLYLFKVVERLCEKTGRSKPFEGNFFLPYYIYDRSLDFADGDLEVFSAAAQQNRSEYHPKLLLGIRTKNPEKFRAFKNSLIALEKKKPSAEYAMFLSVAISFMDCVLQDGVTELSQDVISYMSRIDLGVKNACDKLPLRQPLIVSKMLYFVMSSGFTSSRVQMLVDRYGINELLNWSDPPKDVLDDLEAESNTDREIELLREAEYGLFSDEIAVRTASADHIRQVHDAAVKKGHAGLVVEAIEFIEKVSRSGSHGDDERVAANLFIAVENWLKAKKVSNSLRLVECEDLLNSVLHPEAAKAKEDAKRQRLVHHMDEIDQESKDMFLIFADEAKELIETIDAMKDEEFHGERVVEVRRAFHTMKGGARMVSLENLGEFFFEIEKLFNELISTRSKDEPAQGLLTFAKKYASAGGKILEMLDSKGCAVIPLSDLRQAIFEKEFDRAPAEIDMNVEISDGSNLPGMHEEAPSRPAMTLALEPVEPQKVEPSVEIAVESEATGAPIKLGAVSVLRTGQRWVEPDFEADQDIFDLFSQESREFCAALLYEADTIEKRVPTRMFARNAHALKGVCNTVGFPVLAEMVGVLENWATIYNTNSVRVKVEQRDALIAFLHYLWSSLESILVRRHFIYDENVIRSFESACTFKLEDIEVAGPADQEQVAADAMPSMALVENEESANAEEPADQVGAINVAPEAPVVTQAPVREITPKPVQPAPQPPMRRQPEKKGFFAKIALFFRTIKESIFG